MRVVEKMGGAGEDGAGSRLLGRDDGYDWSGWEAKERKEARLNLVVGGKRVSRLESE